jgi:hypothetical protein
MYVNLYKEFSCVRILIAHCSLCIRWSVSWLTPEALLLSSQNLYITSENISVIFIKDFQIKGRMLPANMFYTARVYIFLQNCVAL